MIKISMRLLALALILVGFGLHAQVPFINSIDKSKERAQGTVTLKGLNFGNSTANVKVWFGGAGATPTAISDQLIEVKVPFGAYYENVRVQNTSTGLSAGSAVPFLPSFGGQTPFDETRLGTQQNFETVPGSGLYEHALADFDGDGKLDMATANKEATNIHILRNTSTPGVISFVSSTLSPSPGVKTIHVTAGDVNGDAKPDVLVTESNGATLFLYRNTSILGNISFVRTTITLPGSKANQIRIEDMDLDGKPDLIITDQATGASRFFVLRNQSTLAAISMAAPQIISLPSTAGTDGIFIQDMNGDHRPDIAMGEFLTANSRIYILRNTSAPGTVSFFQYDPIEISTTVSNFVIGDLDGDQKPDVALTLLLSASVMVLKNETTGTELDFAEPVLFSAGTRPWGIDIGDADGDGKMDLAVASITTPTITILNNTSTAGNISFIPKTKTTTFVNRIIRFGDVDSDGRPDLTFTSIDDLNSGTLASKVSVMRNLNCVTPVVTPPGPLTICNTFTQRLQASESPGALYEWFRDAASLGAPSAQSFLDVTVTGSYTVRLTDAGCSRTSNAVQINVIGAASLSSVPNINPVTPVCINGTLNLSVNNVGATAYNWTGPGGFSATGLSVNRTNFQPAHAGIYNLNVIVGTCIADQKSVIVDVIDVPSLSVQFEGADIICAGGTKMLTFLPQVSNYTYQWAEATIGNISGATGSTLTVSTTGEYLVKLTSTLNGSCPVIISPEKKLRIVAPPVVDFTFPTMVCTGSVTQFTNGSTADLDPQDPTVLYDWDFGDGGTSTDEDATHTFTSAQNFNVELTVSYRGNTCPSALQKSVTVQAAPTVQILTPDDIDGVCGSSDLELSVSGTHTSYLWSTGATTPTITVNNPGTYTVEVVSGCVLSATRTLDSYTVPNAKANAAPRSISIGDVVALTASGLANYQWSPVDGIEFPDQASTNAIPPGNITYTVSGKDSNGCYDEASVIITVVGQGSLGLLHPKNFLTPNGDTFNPIWEVENAPVAPQCGVTIFDELGIKVFEAKPYNNDWDGTSSKGNKLPAGVYFYIIRCDDSDGILKGSINLIR